MTDTRPQWETLLDETATQWEWRAGRLYHSDALTNPYQPPRMGFWRRVLLEHVYAAHNASRSVRRSLGRLLAELAPDEWALNIGAGLKRIHSRVINVDLHDSDVIDIVTRGQRLPFASDSLALAISQEVLEHLQDPQETIKEVHRVLKVGGRFYCQVPFIIGYHHGPHDYWRFTREGIEQLFDPQYWSIQEISTSVGHGTGFYRIAVEFFAVSASALHRKIYVPVKALFAIILLPLRAADLLTPFAAEADRIPGGYLCVATKRGGS